MDMTNQDLIIEDLIEKSKNDDKNASECLLETFAPLFNKYISILTEMNINWKDKESKDFLMLFIDNDFLKKALKRKKISAEKRNEVFKKFNLISITYGSQPIEDILIDLKLCFLILIKRYKNTGKSFNSYIYNSYKYELARLIKNAIKDPIAMSYKHTEIDNVEEDKLLHQDIYFNDLNILDLDWVKGKSCSIIFSSLSDFQRKIFVKYYIENWNDKQIAREFGFHINTIYLNRRKGLKKLSIALNKDVNSIKRNRKSGKKASLPL